MEAGTRVDLYVREFVTWLGFFSSCASMMYAISIASQQSIDLWLGVAIGFGCACVVVFSILLTSSRKNIKYVSIIFPIIIALIINGTSILNSKYVGDAVIISGVLVGAIVMLAWFRKGVRAYALWCIASGLIVSIKHGIAAGFAITIAMAVIFAALNYCVQLVLDHRREAGLILLKIRNRNSARIIRMSVYLLIPAIFFTLLGLYVNNELQKFIKIQIYDTQIVRLDPSDTRQVIDRDLQSDVIFTLNQDEASRVAGYQDFVRGADEYAVSGALSFKEKLPSYIEKHRPGGIDKGVACRNAGFRILRKRVTLRGLCGDIIDGVNKSISNSFERVKGSIANASSSAVDKSLVERDQLLPEVTERGVHSIRHEYDIYRAYVKRVFFIAKLYGAVSYIVLIAALMAAFQIIIGRILYNHSDDDEINTFRLDGGEVNNGLQMEALDDIVLNDGDARTAGVRAWYIFKGASLKGKGTSLNITIPCPISGIFKRIISGRWVATKVEINEKVKLIKGDNAPRLSTPGDSLCVRIFINDGDEVCFKIGSLLAMSDGIRLASVYTTYVGAYFLGLGSFYTVAKGHGFIVLRSVGTEVYEGRRNHTTPVARLLAWTRGHAFSLEQQLGMFGVWLNEPSVVLRSRSGAAIIDEKCIDRFPFLSRLWRLIRFLFLPI